MGLESADFIPELLITNPIGSSDFKSQGDDHLRLIKKAIKGSFPNFVGTTGVPKSISLTEDELNDAAQKSAIATISALWNYTTRPQISGDNIAVEPILQNQQNGNYTLVLTDARKHIRKSSGGSGETYTIPSNASVPFKVGTAIPLVNQGGGTLAIDINSDTLTLEGNGATGERTLANEGIATILKVTVTGWIISGGNSLT